MRLTVEQHEQTAAAIRRADEALGDLLRLHTLPQKESRRIGTMLRSLGVVQSNLEEKLLHEHPRAGNEMLHVYYP